MIPHLCILIPKETLVIIVLSFIVLFSLVLGCVEEKSSNTKSISTIQANSPWVVTPFEGDIDSISKGNETESRTENALCDYLRIYSWFDL